MRLNELKPAPGSRKAKRIVGRGEGSTLGQTCGKGQKGQTCRSGDTIMVGFEGGQMPLVRRIPKRGFRHPQKIHYQPINLSAILNQFESGSLINGEVLFKCGLLHNAGTPFVILGGGDCQKTFKVVAPRWSKKAEEAIKKGGGTLDRS